MKKTLLLILTLTLFALNSCIPTGDKVKDLEGTEDSGNEITVKEIEYLLPSPGEVLDIVRDLGLNFDIGLVAPLIKPSDFILYRNQALNFGCYLTDFSYLLLFEKHSESLNYLTRIQEMAKLLGIEMYFDNDFFNGILSNLNRPDTLKSVAINQTALFFNRMESIGNKDLVLLITTGALVEVIFITSNILEEKHINDNTVRTMANLAVVFDAFYLHFLTSKPNDTALQTLSDDLQKIRNTFKSMTINNTSTVIKQNGKLEISSKIDHQITNEKVAVLKALIRQVRSKMVNQEY
jgi:hypothetical protein